VKDQMRIPDVGEIDEFFGAGPIDHATEDGYWCYEVADSRGLMLRFSFSLYERSVQTSLSLHGEQVVTVSHEQADDLAILAGKLRCEFSSDSSKTTLQIALRDSISVLWSTMRTA
jgi:hypothetical protein